MRPRAGGRDEVHRRGAGAGDLYLLELEKASASEPSLSCSAAPRHGSSQCAVLQPCHASTNAIYAGRAEFFVRPHSRSAPSRKLRLRTDAEEAAGSPPVSAASAAGGGAAGGSLSGRLDGGASASLPPTAAGGTASSSGTAAAQPWQQKVYIDPPLGSEMASSLIPWPHTYLASVLPGTAGGDARGPLWDAWRDVEPAVAACAQKHVLEVLSRARAEEERRRGGR